MVPITNELIRLIQESALEEGDQKLVDTCNRALSGDLYAVEECRRVFEKAVEEEADRRRAGRPAN